VFKLVSAPAFWRDEKTVCLTCKCSRFYLPNPEPERKFQFLLALDEAKYPLKIPFFSSFLTGDMIAYYKYCTSLTDP